MSEKKILYLEPPMHEGQPTVGLEIMLAIAEQMTNSLGEEYVVIVGLGTLASITAGEYIEELSDVWGKLDEETQKEISEMLADKKKGE